MDAANIKPQTFYRWMREKSDFSDTIARAKKEYRRYCPEEMKRLAHKRLYEYLEGTAVETWEKRTIVKNQDGEVVKIEEQTTTVRRPCPEWALRRVLGESMNFLSAINVLVNEEMLPERMLHTTLHHLESLEKDLRLTGAIEVNDAD